MSVSPGVRRHGMDNDLETAATARQTHDRIVEVLESLLCSRYVSPLELGFTRGYRRFLVLFDRYQRQMIQARGTTPSCVPGCTTCCCQWVEDVCSFETLIIAERILRRHRQRLSAIIAACRRDIEAMERLDEMLDQRPSAGDQTQAASGPHDSAERLLSAFYALRRPCPLLTDRRLCLVYDIRPLTCRAYYSFSPPSRCDPDYTDEHDVPTCLVDLEENAGALLDELHARYDTLDNDTSLRSALATCLSRYSAGEEL